MMESIKKAWSGEYSLAFTFWVLCCIIPIPFSFAKVYLRENGILVHEDMLIFLAGQVFLWVEWAFFAFITVALWNASGNHLLAAQNNNSKRLWGHLGRLLAVASAILAMGSFFNLSGLSELIFGEAKFLFPLK